MSRQHKIPRVAISSIVCPFFGYLDKKYPRFTCEPVEKEAVSAALRFNSRDDLNRFLGTRCAADPKSCIHYRLLMAEKYPGVEELDFEKIKSELYQHDEKGETP